jgi:soluble lytic murein transglycosylase-like protein
MRANPPRSATTLLPLAFMAALLCPVAVQAQVLEIGESGDVTVYDRPTVFNAEGGEPIPREEPVVSRARVAAPAATMAALQDAAHANGLSPDLVEAVAWRESRLRPGLISRAGAIGEMQLMPGTARDLGVNPYDTRQNFQGGAAYLSAMLRRYDGDLVRALAAYNAGPGAVDRYRGVPPYKETRDYVTAILERLSERSAVLTVASGK